MPPTPRRSIVTLFTNPVGKLSTSEGSALEAALNGIYDKYDVSVFIILLSNEGENMEDYAKDFFLHSVGRYTGIINRGVIFVYDMETKERYTTFHDTDDRK